MKDIVKLFVSLGLVCAIGCAALVFVDRKTQEPRRAVAEKTLNDNLLMVLPAGSSCVFDSSKKIEKDGVVFHRAYDNGKLAAIVAETSGAGFGGAINALVGIDVTTGKIVQVVVTGHTETPGLGTQATDRQAVKSLWRKSELKEGELPPNAFLDSSFQGKDICEFEIGKADASKPALVEAVSGATYSSKGVLAGVNKACAAFNAHKSELLK